MFLRKQGLSRMLMKVMAIVLTIAVILPSTLSDVAEAAKTPKLSITKNVVVGKKLTLNVKNKIAGSKYTWKSSNKKVATINKKGVVKGVKAGKAKITCKITTAKKTYTLKGTVKVVAKKNKPVDTVVDNVTVATQDELTKALANKNLTKITINTSEEENFVIATGTYSNTALVVNAPKSDVTNSAVFKSIQVDEIKANTWTEKAKGNNFDFRATEGRLVIAAGAEVKDLTLRGAKATVVADGTITGKVIVAAAVVVELTGDGTTAINVVVEVAGAKLTTSIAINLNLTANAEVIFNKGSEASTVTKSNDSVKEEITNNTDSKIEVKENTEDKEPTTPTNPTTPDGSGSSGSGSNGGSGSDAVTKVAINKEEVILLPSGSAIVADTVVQLSATVFPSTASDKTVEWSSSDEKVAIVDATTGKVTAVTTTTGTAIITVTTNGKNSNGKVETATCKIKVEDKKIVVTNFTTAHSVDGAANQSGNTWLVDTNYKQVRFVMPEVISYAEYPVMVINGTNTNNFTLKFFDKDNKEISGSAQYGKSFTNGTYRTALPSKDVKYIAFDSQETTNLTITINSITFIGSSGIEITDFTASKDKGYGTGVYDATSNTWSVGSDSDSWQMISFDLPKTIDTSKYTLVIRGIVTGPAGVTGNDAGFRVSILNGSNKTSAGTGYQTYPNAFNGAIEVTLPATGTATRIGLENKDKGACTFKLESIVLVPKTN